MSLEQWYADRQHKQSEGLVVGALVRVRQNGECTDSFCRIGLDNNGVGEIIGVYTDPHWPQDRKAGHYYRVRIDPFNPRHKRGDKAAGCIAMFSAFELELVD